MQRDYHPKFKRDYPDAGHPSYLLLFRFIPTKLNKLVKNNNIVAGRGTAVTDQLDGFGDIKFTLTKPSIMVWTSRAYETICIKC